MENLKIISISENGRKYTLKNIKTQQVYVFTLKLLGVDEVLEVGSTLAMHSELLDPKYIEYSTDCNVLCTAGN